MTLLDPITFTYIHRYGDGEERLFVADKEGYSYVSSWDLNYLLNRGEHNIMTVERSEDTLRVAFSGHSTISDLYSASADYFSIDHDSAFNIWAYAYKTDITLGDGGDSNVRIKNILTESSIQTGDGNDDITVLMSQYERHQQSQLLTIDSGDGNDVITIDTHENALDIQMHADIHAGTGHDYILVELRGDNTINAGSGDDTIITDGGDDYILGGSGENIISAGLGVDTIAFTGNYDDYDIEVIDAANLKITRLGGDFEIHHIQSAEYFEFADLTIDITDLVEFPENYFLGNIDDFTFNFIDENNAVEIIDSESGNIAYSTQGIEEFTFTDTTMTLDQLKSYTSQEMPVWQDGSSSNSFWDSANFKTGKLYLSESHTRDFESDVVLEFSNLDHVIDIAFLNNYGFPTDENDYEIYGDTIKLYDFTFNLGSGDDYMDVSWGYVTVNAGAGDDFIESGWYDDVLDGGDGNDTFNTGWGNDVVDGGNGIDTVMYNDIGAGTYLTADLELGTVIKSNTDTDTLTNVENIIGSKWGDRLYGNAQDNELSGINGNDTIEGRDGNDTLIGGLGNDTLRGGQGDDTYKWNKGDGNDTLYEEGGLDKIILGPGITLSDIEFDRQGNTLTIHIDGSEFLTIDKQYGVDSRAIDSLVFADGGEILITEKMHIIGSEEAENIQAFTDNNTLEGLAGNDVLQGGLALNDTASYQSDIGAIVADLNLGYAEDGFGNTDTLISIENIIGSAFNDVIKGNAETNILTGGTGSDKLYANGGNDTLNGDDGNDQLWGMTGTNILNGGGGTDVIYSGSGDDTIDGGDAANDWVDYTAAASGVSVNLATGTATGHGNDTLTGIERVKGSYFTDTITGDAHNNEIYGFDGNDTIYGGDGSDVIAGGNGNDTIDGGDTSDALYGNAGDDIFLGSAGNDVLFGGEGIDTADYSSRDEVLTVNLSQSIVIAKLAGAGLQTLHDIENIAGGGHNDSIFGNAQNNILSGNGGNDNLYANDGDDELYGGAGQDYLQGDSGSNTLSGGAGADIIRSGSGNDAIDGGDGRDWLFYTHAQNDVNINLANGTASGDGIDTITGIEKVQGGGGNDTLIGDNNNNEIYGWNGTDIIRGGGGNDVLAGGNGNDEIYGGAGLDILYGAGDDDTFIFEGETAFDALDRIMDYSGGDTIDIGDVLSDSGYQNGIDALNEWVQITNDGANSYIDVDRDGAGTNYSFDTIARVDGTTALQDSDLIII